MIRKIREKHLSSKFSKDTIWLLTAQVVLMLSGLTINLTIGQYSGTESLGIFNQGLAFYTILSTVFAFGLNNSLVKKIAEGTRDEASERQLLTSNIVTTFTLSLILTVVAIAVALTFPGAFSSSEFASVVYIPFFALPFFNANKNFMSYYAGKREQRTVAIERVIRWAGIAVYILIGALMSWELWVLMLVFVVVEGFLFVVNTVNLANHFDFRFTMSQVAENLLFGIKSYVAEIISVFSSSLDLILVGYFLSGAETGVYSFMIFFVRTVNIFPGIILQNFSPVISNLWENQQLELIRDRIRQIKRINLKVITLQVIFLLVFYKLVILYFKQDFADSYVFFLIALTGVFVNATIGWSGSMLVMTGKLKENIVRTVMIIVVSICSTVILSYYFGLLGACIAVCINGLLSFFMTGGVIYKVLGVKVI